MRTKLYRIFFSGLGGFRFLSIGIFCQVKNDIYEKMEYLVILCHMKQNAYVYVFQILFTNSQKSEYRHSLILMSTIFDLTRFVNLSYFHPL